MPHPITTPATYSTSSANRMTRNRKRDNNDRNGDSALARMRQADGESMDATPDSLGGRRMGEPQRSQFQPETSKLKFEDLGGCESQLLVGRFPHISDGIP